MLGTLFVDLLVVWLQGRCKQLHARAGDQFGETEFWLGELCCLKTRTSSRI